LNRKVYEVLNKGLSFCIRNMITDYYRGDDSYSLSSVC
jgi:hypothetical protein